MKISAWIKNSSNLSLSISVGLHLFLLTGFGLWQQKNHTENIIKIPAGHTINLGGFNVRTSSKNLMPTASNTSRPREATSEVLKQSPRNVQPVETTNPALISQTGAEAQGALTSNVTTSSATSSGSGNSGDATELTPKQKYFADFRTIIESRKQYPQIARMRGMEGVVVVSVLIKNNGEVSNHKIIKASGFSALDDATLNLIKRITTFKSFPHDLNEAEVELKLPIAYKLNG